MDFLNIKETIKESGFTYESLGKEVGLSKVSIARIANGDQTPSFETLYKIAEKLNVDIRHLFKPTKGKNLIGVVLFDEKEHIIRNVADLESLLKIVKQ